MHTMEKETIDRNSIPENYTFGPALFEALPPLFFGIAAVLLGTLLHSALFLAGAFLFIAFSEAGVIWKLIVIRKQKNIRWLSSPMRQLRPAALALMIIGAFCCREDPVFSYILYSAREFPVSVCLLACVLCFVLIRVFRAVFGSGTLRSRWIEQIFSCAGQFALLFGVILLVYSADYYHADKTAQDALSSTSTVQVYAYEDKVLFKPETGSEQGLIFYPGGNVEFTAYAPLLRNLAEKGITCVAVRMPLQLALFNQNAANLVMAEHPGISRWYLAGHSLGGAVASMYAHENSYKLRGLILLAAYSTKPINHMKVLSVYGSEDGVLNRNAYEKNKVNLPEDVTELVIPGGNHAQFGSYGLQDGDGTAALTPEAQWEVTCDAIVQFITSCEG